MVRIAWLWWLIYADDSDLDLATVSSRNGAALVGVSRMPFGLIVATAD